MTFPVCISAQNNTNNSEEELFAEGHLKFKGISLGCKPAEFQKALESKGFKLVEKTEDGYAGTCSFMGTTDATLVVYNAKDGSVTYCVAAMMEAGKNWTEVERAYINAVDLYKEKYGEPAAHIEDVDGYSPKDNGIYYLRDGKVDYQSSWEFEAGEIIISLVYELFKPWVLVVYRDRVGRELQFKEILDEI